MQMPLANINSSNTDFYLLASQETPLLSAAQEQACDRRKWAATRRSLRFMLNDKSARCLLAEFAQACLEQPPAVEQFDPRSLFFTLRKDIAEFYPGGAHREAMELWSNKLGSAAPTRELLALAAQMNWPTTLVMGLAALLLRRSGHKAPDLIADAMLIWQPQWRRVSALETADKTLALNLKRYLHQRDTLVLHNLRLVHKLAWDQPLRGVNQHDLVQEGIIGLVRAAEKYDYRRGFRFTTYAYPWINQHLQRASEGRGSLISYPTPVLQDINHLHKARMQWQESTGHDPGINTLSELTGMPQDKVNKLRRLTNITVSIDHPEDDDPQLATAANLEDPNSDSAVISAQQSSVSRLLQGRIDLLDDKEQQVLFGRWGLDGRPQRTFSQLADQLKVSREWVRQLEKSALKKLAQEDTLKSAYLEMET